MKKFKILSLLVGFAMVMAVLVGCTSNEDLSSDGSSKVEGNLKVGMSTDEGGIGDKSFNDAAHRGLQRAEEEFGINLQVLEPQQDSEFIPFTARLAEENDLVIGVGFKLKEAIEEAAKQNPDKNFILIDDHADGINVTNITFEEHEGSFLAGVVAGLMTKNNKVGFIGGIESPLIEKFEVGFIAGVKAVNPEAAAALEDGSMIRYAGSFSDVNKGYELGKSIYNDGADIIFHAAGGVGIGMINAAVETGNYAIGVDSDQAETIPEAKDHIITSMVKNIDQAVYDAVKSTIEVGFHRTDVVLGLGQDGFTIPNTSGLLTQDVLDQVENFRRQIIDGYIVVPSTREEYKELNK